MAERTITHAEHLQMLGLVTIARQHQRKCDEAAAALLVLLGDTGDPGVTDVPVWDVLTGDRDLDWLLKHEKITVEPVDAPDPVAAAHLRIDGLMGALLKIAEGARATGRDDLADAATEAVTADAELAG